jgi:hypothetical protein
MPLTPAPAAEPITTTGLPRQETWTIRFTQSGGIMGMTREMEIHSDGQLKAADDRTGREAASQLTEAELTRLQNLVNNLAYNAKSGPTSCADCFNYTLEISSGSGKPFTAQADDVSLEASGLSPLVEYLRTLMERALNTQG